MKRFPYIHRALAVLALGVLSLTGCTDAITGEDEAVELQPRPAASKLRHEQLLYDPASAGKILEEFVLLGTTTDFVVRIQASTFKILEEYYFKILEDYDALPGVTIKQTYKGAYPGFALHVEEAHLAHLLEVVNADPNILWIEPDPKVRLASGEELLPKGAGQLTPWGVKAAGAHIGSMKAGNGQGSVPVDLYILDSGIGGRDLNVVERKDFVGSEVVNRRHGTHVAGVAAAIDDHEDIVGVAPGARIHDFRVLDENGQADLSTVIAAVDEITSRKQANPAVPIVVNISFGGKVGTTEYNALDEAIQSSIAAGVVYVLAAGNAGQDASLFSPAHVREAITVGAHNELNVFSAYSNHGSVIDVLAPGSNIVSLHQDPTSDALTVMSGTSMAAPHVAGAAAYALSLYPSATPQQIRDGILGNGGLATLAPLGTTSRRLYVGGW